MSESLAYYNPVVYNFPGQRSDLKITGRSFLSEKLQEISPNTAQMGRNNLCKEYDMFLPDTSDNLLKHR